jgi:hypothetical protein
MSVATVQTPSFSGTLQFAFASATDAEKFTEAVNSGR